MRNHAATAVTLLLAAAFGACGGEKPTTTSTGPPERAGTIPEDLKGIWEARILDDELAVPPDDLPEEPSVWTLKFLGTGGEDNGPSVFLSNDRAGEFAGPISVSGQHITLEFEPTCQKYRFQVTERVGNAAYPGRRKLYLLPVDDLGGCPSTGIGSVLAARGWTGGPGAPAPEDVWPLERIRTEGSPGDQTVMEDGLTTRAYVVCDGPRSVCEKDGDAPLRIPYQHAALEVTQDGRSALFGLGANEQYWATGFDANSVFVMDDPLVDGPTDVSDHVQMRYRLLRVDGSEVPLKLVMDPVPAVPGAGVLVIDYSTSADPETAQHAFLVNERKRTLRPLDLPRNADLGFTGRYWGPNTEEFLWFVYVNCRVYWIAGGTLEKRRLDCADDFEFNWAGGDFTYVHGDWFPDGWLKPGRMALLERIDDRLILHVSLDRGKTWQRIPVSDEAAVPDTLRRRG